MGVFPGIIFGTADELAEYLVCRWKYLLCIYNNCGTRNHLLLDSCFSPYTFITPEHGSSNCAARVHWTVLATQFQKTAINVHIVIFRETQFCILFFACVILPLRNRSKMARSKKNATQSHNVCRSGWHSILVYIIYTLSYMAGKEIGNMQLLYNYCYCNIQGHKRVTQIKMMTLTCIYC